MKKRSTVRTRAMDSAAYFLGAKTLPGGHVRHVLHLKKDDGGRRIASHRRETLPGGAEIWYDSADTFLVRNARVNCIRVTDWTELRKDDELTLADGSIFTVDSEAVTPGASEACESGRAARPDTPPTDASDHAPPPDSQAPDQTETRS